jgi:N-formylglutamate amidohydrolase
MMEAGLSALFEKPFEILVPTAQSVPFVFNIPHSGRIYPAAFLAQSRLDQHTLRRSEDCFVDTLFESMPAFGAPLLMAHFPRAFLDANREPYELDPRMFEGRLPSFANTRSLRVAGGLGVVPRVVGEGQDIYRARMPVHEALERIDQLYRPYHRALRGLLNSTHRQFGECILFDCHSMPSASIGPECAIRHDIVLGDRFGTSCAPSLICAAQEAFEHFGYTVTRNRPYAGGFITEHYGDPAAGHHALQIEINRALYMDETKLEPHAGLPQLKNHLNGVIALIRQKLASGKDGYLIAAE